MTISSCSSAFTLIIEKLIGNFPDIGIVNVKVLSNIYSLVKLEKACNLILLLDMAGETQVRKVELPWLSAQVKGEKKQKLKNKKAFAQKEGKKIWQN